MHNISGYLSKICLLKKPVYMQLSNPASFGAFPLDSTARYDSVQAYTGSGDSSGFSKALMSPSIVQLVN